MADPVVSVAGVVLFVRGSFCHVYARIVSHVSNVLIISIHSYIWGASRIFYPMNTACLQGICPRESRGKSCISAGYGDVENAYGAVENVAAYGDVENVAYGK